MILLCIVTFNFVNRLMEDIIYIHLNEKLLIIFQFF